MKNKESNAVVKKERLTIPIYLNTKIVFDMLATIEDGFSEVKNIQTSVSESQESNVGADIGTGNHFALLSVGVSGQKKTGRGNDTRIIEEKTHTPVSLFQRLLGLLDEANLVKRDVASLELGDFIELQGALMGNPLEDVLSSIVEMMELERIFTDNKGNGSKGKNRLSDEEYTIKQLKQFIDKLNVDGIKDIVCKSEKMNIVLPTDVNYFLNKNTCEITDGNYKVLGKIMNICKGDEEISLLRNTALSKIQLTKLIEFKDLFNTPELAPFVGEAGIETTVKAPAIMIIPIAIYI